MLPELDDNGLLVNSDAWSESVAQELATLDGIGKLTEDHWRIILALRDYYARFGVAPAMSQICHAQGREWHWAHDLFHTCLGAWRVAGLPDPGEEAKSYLSAM